MENLITFDQDWIGSRHEGGHACIECNFFFSSIGLEFAGISGRQSAHSKSTGDSGQLGLGNDEVVVEDLLSRVQI